MSSKTKISQYPWTRHARVIPCALRPIRKLDKKYHFSVKTTHVGVLLWRDVGDTNAHG